MRALYLLMAMPLLAADVRTIVPRDQAPVFPPAVASGLQGPSDAGELRQTAAARDGRAAVAAVNGLYVRGSGGTWSRVFPRDGHRSWAPVDVRAVVFDSRGRLWFASPQGVGVEEGGEWRLYTGAEGLPYDDFTTAAPAPDGSVWFGTKRGAIRFDGKAWAYRQGRRWLPDDFVRSIVVNGDGAWFDTPAGVSRIERSSTTLAEKARWFEAEIDKRHRRTPYGYVLGVALKRPGDASEFTQHDSDNDGLWTSMYGAGECFAYAATGSAEAKDRARRAFESLRFLRTVTQGGRNPAPPGFVARTVRAAALGDPNQVQYAPEKDRQTRANRDALWKVLSPRWPLSADGQWYWKADTSSDELDGHFFFYGLYYDLVAKTEAERQPVREQVAAIADHLVSHGFQFVDHDGKVTRWGVFNPENLNHSPNWWEERGINSLSILSYLRTAQHITGDKKYDDAAARLVRDHGYDANVLIPKSNLGAGAGNQSDDEMIFMCFYNLLRYETDAALAARYAFAFFRHWTLERPEMNPLFNFLYAHAGSGKSFRDSFGLEDLTPQGDWMEDSVETLERYPLDRFNWRHENRHRKDLVLIAPGRGRRVNGKVIPIDERWVEHWNHDPWALDTGGAGTSLADGASFLLPYYLGRYAGYLKD